MYRFTNDIPHITALYCAAIPTLADRREQLSRQLFIHTCMPICKVWIYRLLFVCVCMCVCLLFVPLIPVHASNNVEATFDFVAKNGNNVERVLR